MRLNLVIGTGSEDREQQLQEQGPRQLLYLKF